MSICVKTSRLPKDRQYSKPQLTARLLIALALVGVSSKCSAESTNQILNSGQSKIAFEVSSPGLSCDGRFTDFAGNLRINGGDLKSAKVNLSLNIDSVSLPQDQIMQAILINTLIQRLRSKTATFESSAFEPLGGNEYLVSGIYTFEGKSKRGSLPIKLVSATPKKTEIRLNFLGQMKGKEAEQSSLSNLGKSVQGNAESKLIFIGK